MVERTAAASLAADEQLKMAEAADEARKALLAARAELERLEARKDEIDALRLRVEVATRADKVQPASDRLAEARRQTAAAASSRLEAEQALAAARVAEETAAEVWPPRNRARPSGRRLTTPCATWRG